MTHFFELNEIKLENRQTNTEKKTDLNNYFFQKKFSVVEAQ